MTTAPSADPSRPRLTDVPATNAGSLSNAVQDLYDDTLDVVVVRQAWAPDLLTDVASSLDRSDRGHGWNRPNAAMPPEDIQVLGTAATPTYSTPTGPTLEGYLEDADWYARDRLFGDAFNPTTAVATALARHAGGRRVEVLQAPGGRSFSPFTVRRLAEGKGIGLHHDLHTSLAMFREVSPGLDTSTLISWVFTLQGPDEGGELCVYDCSPATPDPPKMPNGFMWDLQGVERRFGAVKVQTGPGDLFLFASARLLHRVSPVVGPHARLTLGGFLALDKPRDRVLFWS